jgi:hypothetical protein
VPQSVHVALLVALVAALHLPESQSMQPVRAVLPYLPAPHDVHVVTPAPEYAPASQSTHASDTSFLPAAQSVHDE